MPIYYCDGKRLKRGIYASANWLTQNRELVNSLNVFPIPDGDTGTNMSLTLHKVIETLENMNTNHLPQVAGQIADSSLWGARGSSGVILSQILQGLAEGVGNNLRINSMDIALALKISAQRAYSAIDKPAEGTILTLLREIAESAVTLAKEEKDIAKLLNHILEVGEETLIRTKDLLPELKRAGVIDAGGKGFLIMIEGILKLIEGTDFKSRGESATRGRTSRAYKLEITRPIIHREEMEERYCLDFVLKTIRVDIPISSGTRINLKKEIEIYGNDIVLANSRNITKVHIHTNNPDKVLEIAQTYGTVEEIKIDDMQKQHIQFTNEKMGIIAVVSGDGMREIFVGASRRLAPTDVVEGGQTMNPSVEELKLAIQRIPAEKVFLLPNNINIIPAAKQAGELSGKKVYIIPSKTLPEGISAITAFSQEDSVEENIERMSSSIDKVKSGEVTRAVRDSEVRALKIKKGDYIGIHNHSILVATKRRELALLSLLKGMVDEKDSIISIFYRGREENIDELFQKINNAFPELDIETYYGGQPHYDYIVAVE